MVIGTLIVFASVSVQLRVPKEGGNDENAIIKLIDWIPFLNSWCYFEINYVMKSVLYPGLFHMALHVSRILDVAPEAALKQKLLMAQRELTKSLLALEMCTGKRKDEIVDPPAALEESKENKPDEEGKTKENDEEPSGMVLRSGKVVGSGSASERGKNSELGEKVSEGGTGMEGDVKKQESEEAKTDGDKPKEDADGEEEKKDDGGEEKKPENSLDV